MPAAGIGRRCRRTVANEEVGPKNGEKVRSVAVRENDDITGFIQTIRTNKPFQKSSNPRICGAGSVDRPSQTELESIACATLRSMRNGPYSLGNCVCDSSVAPVHHTKVFSSLTTSSTHSSMISVSADSRASASSPTIFLRSSSVCGRSTRFAKKRPVNHVSSLLRHRHRISRPRTAS